MSQAELARRAQLSQKHISYLVLGKSRVTPPVAARIERALDAEGLAGVLVNMQMIYDLWRAQR